MFGRRFDQALTEATTKEISLIVVDLETVSRSERQSGVTDRLVQLHRAAMHTCPEVTTVLVGPPHKSWQAAAVKQLVHDLTMTFSTHAWCGLLPERYNGHLPSSRKYTVASTSTIPDTPCRGCQTHGPMKMCGLERAAFETAAMQAMHTIVSALHTAPRAAHAAMTEPDFQAPCCQSVPQALFYSDKDYAKQHCKCGDRECACCSRYFITHVPPSSEIVVHGMSDEYRDKDKTNNTARTVSFEDESPTWIQMTHDAAKIIESVEPEIVTYRPPSAPQRTNVYRQDMKVMSATFGAYCVRGYGVTRGKFSRNQLKPP
eukprot:5420645-Amphidinium_carterae.2